MKDEETLDRVKDDPDQQMFDDEEDGANPYKEVMSKMQRRKMMKEKEADLIKKNISENNYPTILENFEKKFNDFMKELLEHLT